MKNDSAGGDWPSVAGRAPMRPTKMDHARESAATSPSRPPLGGRAVPADNGHGSFKSSPPPRAGLAPHTHAAHTGDERRSSRLATDQKTLASAAAHSSRDASDKSSDLWDPTGGHSQRSSAKRTTGGDGILLQFDNMMYDANPKPDQGQGGERSGLAVRSKPESDRQMVANGIFSDLILAGDHTRSGTPLSLSMDDCPSTDGGFLSGLLGEQMLRSPAPAGASTNVAGNPVAPGKSVRGAGDETETDGESPEAAEKLNPPREGGALISPELSAEQRRFELKQRALARQLAADVAPAAVQSWVDRGWALPQPDGHKSKVLEDYLAEQPFAGNPEIPPSPRTDMGMSPDAVLESVNLSDTPSAVAGRIEREEAILLLKGKQAGLHGQYREQAAAAAAAAAVPGPSDMHSFNNPLAQNNGALGGPGNTVPPPGPGLNKGQIQVVGEARLGAQLTVKGIRGIDRSGQWRFQWQRVWKLGRGQEKVETLPGAKGPHHAVSAEDCGCRLRVVSARRLPNGQVDRTILYALSSFIPPLEAMQLAEQSGVWNLTKEKLQAERLALDAEIDADEGSGLGLATKAGPLVLGKGGPTESGKATGASEKVAYLVETGVAAEIEAERKERDEAYPKEAAVELYRRAAQHYRKASKLGHVDAAVAMARMYERGVGLTPPHTLGVPDHKEAARWYQLAAVEGHSEAMNNLGALYHSGCSERSALVGSIPLAVGWFARAVLAGNSSALCNLGLCFEQGTGVRRDWVQAEQLYREAAEAGSTTALCSLGYLYAAQEQHEAAARAFVLAAEQGHDEGQKGLKRLLQGGRAPKRGTHNNRARNLVRSAQMDPDEESQSGAEGEEANTLQRDRDTDASGLTPTGLSAAPEAAGTSKAEGSKEHGRAVAGAGLPSGPRPSEPLALVDPAVVHGTANGATSVAPGALAAADELTRRRDVDAYGGDYEDGGDGDGDDGGGAGCGLGCLFGRRKHKTAKSGRAGRAGGPPSSKEPAATVQARAISAEEETARVFADELGGLTGDQYKSLSYMLHRALLSVNDAHAATLAKQAVSTTSRSMTTPGRRHSSTDQARPASRAATGI